VRLGGVAYCQSAGGASGRDGDSEALAVGLVDSRAIIRGFEPLQQRVEWYPVGTPEPTSLANPSSFEETAFLYASNCSLEGALSLRRGKLESCSGSQASSSAVIH